MFGVHALLLGVSGTNLRDYFRSVWPVLTFAFSSRSSAATIPLNVETQIDKLNVPTPIANLSATFGSTIGQNGCAGIYPAMLSVMVALSMSGSIEINSAAIVTGNPMAGNTISAANVAPPPTPATPNELMATMTISPADPLDHRPGPTGTADGNL